MDIDASRRTSPPVRQATTGELMPALAPAAQPPSAPGDASSSGSTDARQPDPALQLTQPAFGQRYPNPWLEFSPLAQARTQISAIRPSLPIHDLLSSSAPQVVVRGGVCGSHADSDQDDDTLSAGPIASLIHLPATHGQPESLSAWRFAMPPLAQKLVALSGRAPAERDAVLAEASSLFDVGVDPCEVDPAYGRSILHWVSLMGDATLLTCLLRRGADRQVNALDFQHMTPLALLARLRIAPAGVQRPADTASVVCTLLDHGAQLQPLPQQGIELLFMTDLSPQLAKRLVAMAVPVDGKRIKRETPMLMACHRRNWPLADCLLELGANPRARGLFGTTALHTRDIPEWFAKRLLDCGASPHSRDMTGMTPLMVGCETGNIEVARLLLQYGASAEAIADDNLGVLDIARQTGGAIEQLIREALMLQPALKLASE